MKGITSIMFHIIWLTTVSLIAYTASDTIHSLFTHINANIALLNEVIR